MSKLGQYLSPQEVAARLGITRRTVLQMVINGRLPGAFRLGPKVVRIPEKSVVDLIDRSPAVFR
jgi:excisionase family DNA binding protein